MSAPSEGTTTQPSTLVGKPKSSRKGKIIGVWFALVIWLVILLFSPFRPFDEIWSLPHIFVITNGQLDLPNTVFWVIGATISASLIYFGIGSVQSSTYQTNVVQTPTDWMVKFIISYCWNTFHKDPSIQQDELFTQISNKIPIISALEGSVDVGQLMGTGAGSGGGLGGKSSSVERILAKIDHLSQRMDVSGTILTPIEEDGKKSWMRLNYEPKKSGERGSGSAVATRMLLEPHDIPDLSQLSTAEQQALGVFLKPSDDKSKKDKTDTSQGGA